MNLYRGKKGQSGADLFSARWLKNSQKRGKKGHTPLRCAPLPRWPIPAFAPVLASAQKMISNKIVAGANLVTKTQQTPMPKKPNLWGLNWR